MIIRCTDWFKLGSDTLGASFVRGLLFSAGFRGVESCLMHIHNVALIHFHSSSRCCWPCTMLAKTIHSMMHYIAIMHLGALELASGLALHSPGWYTYTMVHSRYPCVLCINSVYNIHVCIYCMYTLCAYIVCIHCVHILCAYMRAAEHSIYCHHYALGRSWGAAVCWAE